VTTPLRGRITLQGEGLRSEITIRGTNAPALIIQDPQVTVSNLTLLAQGSDVPAIQLENGGMVEKCSIHADHGPGVQADKGKPALLKQCEIFRGPMGLLVKPEANVTLTSCTFNEQEKAAVKVEANGQLHMSDCQLSHCKENGLLTFGRKVTIDNGAIEANGESGIYVKDGVVKLTNVQIKNNGNWGMRVEKNGSFELNRCPFDNNSREIPPGRGKNEMQWKRDENCQDCLLDGEAAPLSR
jgi:hypothetical protein